MVPQKQFPSVKLLFATAARKCGRSEISNYYGQIARVEEREGAANDAEAEPADIAINVDAPLGESDLHDEPHSRLRAGTSAIRRRSLTGESGSIQVQVRQNTSLTMPNGHFRYLSPLAALGD